LLLSGLTASVSRLALVGLAKNTGKTEALAALLRELEREGRPVGVTSVGRDGEERDVIDLRIEKPRVRLPAGSLVATTDGLLRASGLPHELLERTGMRTPLGRVSIARVAAGGVIEVAGPSASRDVRAVSDAMLGHGAEQVLIDGAIDRRAASSPQVADGLLMSTGAVLGEDIADVVSQTSDAVELVRLPSTDEAAVLAAAASASEGEALVEDGGRPVALAPRFVLTSDVEQTGRMLDENPRARWLVVGGALPDAFLRGLVAAMRRRRRELTVVVSDSTRVFLADRGPAWYAQQGVHIRTLTPIDLKALTVNPLAPQSHRLDSIELRARLREALPDVPVFDVLAEDYPSRPPTGARDRASR
jgi:hypothetical protein